VKQQRAASVACETEGHGARKLWVRAAPAVGVIGLLAIAVAFAHGEVWRAGAADVVPVDHQPVLPDAIVEGDVVYEAWLVGRNATTLVSAPFALFDAEPCAPMRRSLTVGIPMIALGAFGIPAALVTSDPILIYNTALTLQSAVAALAMYLLVWRWTRRSAAGLVAALLFAFHPIRLGHMTHPSVWDISFTALSLYFAERLFREGRWRDALALTAAISLQIATDYYPLVAAALLALPFAAWLLLRRAPRRASPAQIALPLAVAALAAVLVLGPYLDALAEGTLRSYSGGFIFAPWSSYAPGGSLFFGWVLLGLALLGALAPAAVALPGAGGDPRAALGLGALALLFVAAGPDTAAQLSRIGFETAFDPHAALARVLPGLSSVRVVERLSVGVLLVACLLAGAGAAWLLERAGRRAAPAACALVALTFLASFGAPPWSGRWILPRIRPAEDSIAFFEELARRGNRGPLFEVPFDVFGERSGFTAPGRVLLTGWHRRRTSACYGSAMPRVREELKELADRLPDPGALRRLRELGFTTILVHHLPDLSGLRLLRPFYLATLGDDPALRLVHRIGTMSAYEIRAEAAPEGATRSP